MKEVEFVEKHLGEYKIKGDEIKVKVCPFCQNGRSNTPYKFFINKEKHTFVCHKGSCGAKGTFNALCKEFGEIADYVKDYKKNTLEGLKMANTVKYYDKPKMKLYDPSKRSLLYAKLRGMTPKTLQHFDFCSDSNENIVFKYVDEKGNHCLNKIRQARKVEKGESCPKTWQEGNGKPILFGMNKTTYDKPLVITEGEFDAMSVFECGYDNVVSIPFGTKNMDWIFECWNYLEGFKDIILFFDNDDAGILASTEVAARLGKERIRIVRNESNFKDANELMFKFGNEKILQMIEEAEEIPVNELIRLSDCVIEERERMKYGFEFLDYYFSGCGMGELVIWTGKRGGGKTTFLNQTLMDAVEQKEKVFLYSGELNNGKVKQWLDKQIAGEGHLIKKYDDLIGREEVIVDPKIANVISEWYRDYLFAYSDSASDNDEEILSIMEYAYKRYNIKRFILDNLKTVSFTGNDDFYRQQGKFAKKLKAFAKKYSVHVDLVVHPKKSGNSIVEDEEVGGSVDIIDLADNVIVVGKITSKMINEEKDEARKDIFMNHDAFLTIRKNRENGDTDKTCYYTFNKESKTFHHAGDKPKTFGWQQMLIERDENPNTLFDYTKEVDWQNVKDEDLPF